MSWVNMTQTEHRARGSRLYRVTCTSCNVEHLRTRDNIKNSNGCSTCKAARNHGQVRTPTYTSWRGMWERCQNPNHVGYKNYGGRGITVCVEWKDFLVFQRDMGLRPANCVIDRIDNTRGYTKENCAWVSRKTSATNRRNTNWLTAHGKTQTISTWALETGLSRGGIRKRLARGLSPEEALRGVT